MGKGGGFDQRSENQKPLDLLRAHLGNPQSADQKLRGGEENRSRLFPALFSDSGDENSYFLTFKLVRISVCVSSAIHWHRRASEPVAVFKQSLSTQFARGVENRYFAC